MTSNYPRYQMGIDEVMRTTGLSKKQIYYLGSRNEFPRFTKNYSRGLKNPKWKSDEVYEWIDANPVRRDH